jgi:hypothetical protein
VTAAVTDITWVEFDDTPDEQDRDAWRVYLTAVDAELAALRDMPLWQKRRNTIWHLAWSEVTTGATIKQVLERRDCVSKSAYYNPDKDWYHNELFQAVLTAVTRLTRAYVENKIGRKLAYREQQIREMEYGAAMALSKKVEAMLRFPVERLEEETEEEDDDGRIIIRRVLKPADWKFRDTAAIMDTASKLGRRSLDMDSDRVHLTMHDEIAALLRKNEIEPDDVIAEFGDELAAAIFKRAGIKRGGE